MNHHVMKSCALLKFSTKFAYIANDPQFLEYWLPMKFLIEFSKFPIAALQWKSTISDPQDPQDPISVTFH